MVCAASESNVGSRPIKVSSRSYVDKYSMLVRF